MNRGKIIIAAFAGAGILGVMALGRKQVFLAFDYAKRELFKIALPSTARPFSDAILDASQAANVSPFITWALGDRESRWGEALTPPGPGGTGDFTSRSWTATPMPPTKGRDGKQAGWGFGLMQLDWNYYADWLSANEWWRPEVIIPKGLAELKKHVSFFAGKGRLVSTYSGRSYAVTDGVTVTYLGQSNIDRYTRDSVRTRLAAGGIPTHPGVPVWQAPDPRPLTGDDLWRAALAAYNGGDANVLRSVAAGKSPDTTTTGANYSMAVMTKAVALSQKLMA